MEPEARPFPEVFPPVTDEPLLALAPDLTASRLLLRNVSEASAFTLSSLFPGFNKEDRVTREDLLSLFEELGPPQAADIALVEAKSKIVLGNRVIGKISDPDVDEPLEVAKRTKRGERLAPYNRSSDSFVLRAK